MTLLSAFEDFQKRTLAGIEGSLAKLLYTLELRADSGEFVHWGLERIHGKERAREAILTSYKQLRRGVLRADFASLTKEQERSSILPTSVPERDLEDAHLNLVFSCLAEHRRRGSRKAA